jgi:predicted aldo/keto reductase-like oxidoreductase
LAVHWGGGPRYDLPYCQRTFPEVLKQVGNDYAQVAMMTMIDEQDRRGEWMEQSLKELRRYQEKGYVGYIGGSAHDPEQAIRAVNSGLLDVLMFGFNLTTHDRTSHQALLQACVDKDVGIVVMKPFSGGTLLNIDGKPTSITPTQCLAYVLSLPISTTVPGAKNADQMRAALAYCTMRDTERDFGPAIEKMYHDLQGHCVYCNHCLPCPEQIDIASVLTVTDWATWGVSDELRAWYASFSVKASACIECGNCEERCPFGVDVITRMRKAVELFEAKAA